MLEPIPLTSPELSGNEERYVIDAIRNRQLSAGPFLSRFEQLFASLCGTREAIGTCNGTSALHLALVGLGLRPGDEVIVPALTFVATANAVRYAGAEPVFIDVDPETWCLDWRQIARALTRRTRGIIAVDLYGHPADMDELSALARQYDLWVVEDAAEAHGATYKGRCAGSLGVAGIFSFYGNKIFTAGEGGAITLDDPELAARIRRLRCQGMDPERRYFFPVTGYNYKMGDMAAAVLCGQLERAGALIAARERVFERYRRSLAQVSGIGVQPVAAWATLAPWLFCITVDPVAFGRSRDELALCLAEVGIETRPFFPPLHRQPPFVEQSRKRGVHLPVTDQLGDTGLNLPTFSAMTEAQVERVSNEIQKARR